MIETINLGKLTFTWRGDYSASETYNNYEIVVFENSVYICVADDPITGQDPTTSNWEIMASGPSGTFAVGDVLVSNTSGIASVSPNASGNVLTSNDNAHASFETFEPHAKDTVKLLNTSPFNGKLSGSLVVMKDNSIKIWGRGDDYVNGTGDTSNRDYPATVHIDSDSPIKKIIGSYNSCLCLLENGEVYSWGNNTAGLLGHGNTTNIKRPTKIAALNGIVITDISMRKTYSHSSHALFLTDDGKVYATGENGSGQCGTGNTTDCLVPTKCLINDSIVIDKISTLNSNIGGVSTALSNDGKLYIWGNGGYGKLGTGNQNHVSTPVNIFFDNKAVVKVDGSHGQYSGSNSPGTTAVLLDDGTVRATGYNYYGQLGIGNTTTQNSFVELTDLGNDNANIFYLGGLGGHPVILKNNGKLYTCGYNNAGQLGNGNTTNQSSFLEIPFDFTVYGGVKKVIGHEFTYYSNGAYTYNNTIVLTHDGSIFGSGYQRFGFFPSEGGVDDNLVGFQKLAAPPNIVDVNISGTDVYDFGIGILDNKGHYYQSGISKNGSLPLAPSSINAAFKRIIF